MLLYELPGMALFGEAFRCDGDFWGRGDKRMCRVNERRRWSDGAKAGETRGGSKYAISQNKE
jgi:hypothetical protein